MSSDHEVIMLDVADLDNKVGRMENSQEVAEYSVKDMSEDARKDVPADCHQAVAGPPRMREGSSKDDIKDKAK